MTKLTTAKRSENWNREIIDDFGLEDPQDAAELRTLRVRPPNASNPPEPTSCSECLHDRQPYEEGFQPGSLDTPSRGYCLPEFRIRTGPPPVWYHPP
jgi:hypothetical protein